MLIGVSLKAKIIASIRLDHKVKAMLFVGVSMRQVADFLQLLLPVAARSDELIDILTLSRPHVASKHEPWHGKEDEAADIAIRVSTGRMEALFICDCRGHVSAPPFVLSIVSVGSFGV